VNPRAGEAIVGRVLTADASHAVLDVDGTETSVDYADVARAVVQVEFSRIEEVELEDVDPNDPDGPEDDLDDLPDGAIPAAGVTTEEG
jgi:ribosome maturation factor RimP